jgi:hypothetical protein
MLIADIDSPVSFMCVRKIWKASRSLCKGISLGFIRFFIAL